MGPRGQYPLRLVRGHVPCAARRDEQATGLNLELWYHKYSIDNVVPLQLVLHEPDQNDYEALRDRSRGSEGKMELGS